MSPVIPSYPGAPDAAGETISMIQKLTQTIEKMESHREDGDIDAVLTTMDRFATFAAAHATEEELPAIRRIMEEFLDEERRRSL